MKEGKEDNAYMSYKPKVFVGFSELDDDDYESEKRVHCPKTVRQMKMPQRQDKQRQRNKSRLKDKQSTQLLGCKRSINEIEEENVDYDANKKKKKKLNKETQNKNKNTTGLVSPFNKNSDVSKINIEIKKESIENNEQQHNSNTHEPSISIDSFPNIKETCYLIKDIELKSITYSYELIKTQLITKSTSIKKALIEKEKHNVLQMSINHPLLTDLKRKLEDILNPTKLWYSSSIQSNLEFNGSNNLLSYCRYDVVGITIAKVVLIPEKTIYHLNQFDIVNFRTIIVNLGSGIITHSVISQEYTQSFKSFYRKKVNESNDNRDSIMQELTKAFIKENSIPYNYITQSPYSIIVLEPGIIHWCNSSMTPSLLVYWSLFRQSNAEYTKISQINKQLSSLNINPSIPLLALQLDILNHTLEHLPVDSIRSYYYDIQEIINYNSLSHYEQIFIEAKAGLMRESSNTQVFFCDYCHNEIFNYYTINKQKQKAYCLKCSCLNINSKSYDNMVIRYKYSQKELDKVLIRMKDIIVSDINRNRNNNKTNCNTNNNSSNSLLIMTSYNSMGSLGYTKKIFKRTLDLSNESNEFDTYLYSYETYSPYADSSIGKDINYDMISNYLIQLIAKDKAKPDFETPLLLSDTKYPYSDCDYLKDDLSLNWVSAVYNNNNDHNKAPKEEKSQLSTMINLSHCSNNISLSSANAVSYNTGNNYIKLNDRLVGNSIFDFAKKVVSENKDAKNTNSNINNTTQTQMKFKFADNNN